MVNWVCPSCRKSFDIPAGWEIPKVCGECRAMVKGGPPKAPIPKPKIADPSPVKSPVASLPGIAFAKRVALVLFLMLSVSAAIAYNIRENQAFEDAMTQSANLDRQLDERIAVKREETLAKFSGPPACVICNGAKKNDCPICIDGIMDCGGCTDGVSTLGGKAERCFICAGKGKLRCDACNGKGEIPCTFCNETGIQK